MEKTSKKLIGGLVVVMLIATIGAVLASGQTDGTSNESNPQKTFRYGPQMNRLGPFTYNLTEEQRTELQTLMETLRNQNATPQEIRASIQQKLDEYGVLDKTLDNEITTTEQRLTILQREKELRNQGYNWTAIGTMIQREFDLQNMTGGQNTIFGQGFGRGPYGCSPIDNQHNTTGDGQDMMFKHGFGRGSCSGTRGFM